MFGFMPVLFKSISTRYCIDPSQIVVLVPAFAHNSDAPTNAGLVSLEVSRNSDFSQLQLSKSDQQKAGS